MKYCLLSILIAFSANAQQNNFINISTQNGLDEAQVYTIVQDHNGFVFIGTNGGGINKYDGFQFESINTTNGLGGNVVYKIIQDDKNNLWAATNGGLSKITGSDIQNYTISRKFSPSILTVFQDSKGTIWAGSEAGAYYLKNGELKRKDIPGFPEKNEVWAFAEDNAGNLWVGSGKGLARLSTSSVKIYTDEEGLSNNSVWSLKYQKETDVLWIGTHTGLCTLENNEIKGVDDLRLNESAVWSIICENNNVWIGTANGLFKYTKNGLKYFTKTEGLINNSVWSLEMDYESNLWVGTTNGISILKDENFVLYGKNYIKDGIWQVFEQADGSILIGTEENGLFTYLNNRFIPHPLNKFLPSKTVWSLFKDKQGTFWIGTDDGLLKLYIDGRKEVLLKGYSILNIYEDKKGNLWFGTYYKGILKYDGHKFKHYPLPIISYIPVHSILEDSRGNIWAATDKMLYKLENDVFINAVESKQLGGYSVMKILEDKNENLWFGLYGGGVAFLNKKEGLIKHITTREGLNNNSILIMMFDNNYNLWIGTNSGLNMLNWKSYMDKGEPEIISFSPEDGLPGTENNQGASLLDSKGNIWIGTINGLLKFNPGKVKKLKYENKIHITSLRLFLEEVDLTPYSNNLNKSFQFLPDQISLPYDINHLTFDFIAINFLSPSAVKYRYKLEGFDTKWSPLTNKTSATYSNLPPGDYTFLVTSINNSNRWNSVPAAYSFSIQKPFWQSYWFYSFVLIFTAGSVYLLYRFRIENIQKRNKELQQRIKDRMVYEEKLAQSERDYRGLFENAHDAFIITNPYTLKIYDANSSAAVLYGYSLEEFNKLHLFDFSIDKTAAQKFWISFSEKKKIKKLELLHVRKDNTSITVDINAKMIKYKGEDAILSIHRDVSERKKFESVLLEAKENAEKSDRLKTEFLAQMSHEIRTPINIILSYTSLIKDQLADKTEAFIQDCFGTIENASRRLIRTVDSILNMAQIQSGNIEINKEVINLKDDLLWELYEEFRQSAKKKSLSLNFIDDAVFKVVEVDKYTVSHLFTNLIHNAIKYTEQGEVDIVLYNIDNQYTAVDISDTGIGISSEYIPHLFEAFTQEEQGYSRKYEGNGLGLALVKKYCELNGAQIKIKSEKGKGTTFTVIFKTIQS